MLDLALTSDQEQLVATVRDFCAREFAPTIQADDRASRHDPEIFAKLASIGLPGVCFPQRYGGGDDASRSPAPWWGGLHSASTSSHWSVPGPPTRARSRQSTRT